MQLSKRIHFQPGNSGTAGAVGEGPNSAITGVHVAYALLVIAAICVFLKLSVKLVIEQRKWKAHDYFAILALAFATAEVIVIGIDVENYGEGQHLATVPTQNLNMVFRLLDHMYIMYEMALMFVKLSILSFYLALFSVKPYFKRVTYFLMAFVVVYLTIFVFIDTFRCTPVKKMWYPVTIPGTCLNGVIEQRAFGILNSISDIAILILPFPVLLKLQMSRSKMISIGLIFSIGAFTCGAAIARTVIIWKSLASSDPTWSVGPEITWMNVEMLVGLICGSLLSTPVLFKHLLRETKVGQSLISLLTRHSRSSNEQLPGESGQNQTERRTDWDRTPGSSMRDPSFHGASSMEISGKAFSSFSNSSGNEKGADIVPPMPTTRPYGNQIGVERTVDISVEKV